VTRGVQNGSDAISDALFAEAAAWHAKLREPDVTNDIHEAFQQWLLRDPRHPVVYNQAVRLWANLGAPQKPGRKEAEIEALISSARRSRRAGRTARRAVVGLVLLLALGAGDWARRGGLDDLRADFVVPRGKHRTVVIADGSTIDLNTNSALAVDLQAGERRVRLFRGEGYFDVSPDPQRPFVVETPAGDVHVTGTVFNVRVLDGKTQVGLIEGGVVLTADDDPDRHVRLKPGEESNLTTSGVSAPREFDAETTTAWRRGQIVFFRTPLADVVKELNRYHSGRIVVLGERLAALPVTGVFNVDAPTEAIDIIEQTLSVRSVRLTDALIVLR